MAYRDFRTYEDSVVVGNKAEKEKLSETKSPKNSWKSEDMAIQLSYLEQKEYKQLEKEIQKLEFKKGEIEQQFITDDLSGDAIAELSKKLKEITDGIETKTERWFKLSAMIE